MKRVGGEPLFEASDVAIAILGAITLGAVLSGWLFGDRGAMKLERRAVGCEQTLRSMVSTSERVIDAAEEVLALASSSDLVARANAQRLARPPDAGQLYIGDGSTVTVVGTDHGLGIPVGYDYYGTPLYVVPDELHEEWAQANEEYRRLKESPAESVIRQRGQGVEP